MAEKGVLLRTNYTGETRYIQILGHVFSASNFGASISMTESGLLPTLKASDVKIMGCPSERNRKSPCLESMVNIWPTPKALDWNKRWSVSHHPRNGLPDAVVKFPTPIASDLRKGAV